MTPDQRERLARIARGQASVRADLKRRASTRQERHERQTAAVQAYARTRRQLHAPHRGSTPSQEAR